MNKDTIYKKLLLVSSDTGIPIKEIIDLLWLATTKNLTFTDAIKELGISRNSLIQILKSINFLLDSKDKTKIHVSSIYLKSVNELFSKSYKLEKDLLNIGVVSPRNNDYFKKRLPPERNFDQFLATPETVIKRVNFMNYLGDIKEKNIAIIGDDDFTSITMARLNIANIINVLEIDGRISSKIQEISKVEGLKIKVMKVDVRNDLPKLLKGTFDVVFTDPPYTENGVSLFLSRAIELLNKNNKSARIYFCFGTSDHSKERLVPVFELISQLGLMIRYVIDKFNRYNGADSIGNTSGLYVAEVTPKSKPTVFRKYEKQIYTGTSN